MRNQLIQIKEEIYEYARKINFEAWFYPEYNGVKGFLGTQNIILLGLNPSSGTFPSKKDNMLYNLLKEKGLENVHISDFIKVRAKNIDVPDILQDRNLIAEQVEFLKKEIELLKPKIIIAMGIQCEDLLKEHFTGLNCRIERIKHYGYRYQKADDVFKEISESLDKIATLF